MFAKTTNIYLFTDDGGLILILRSPTDTNLPLVWETSGGHIDCVAFTSDLEPLKVEALRELKEEMGLDMHPSELKHYIKGSTTNHIAWLAWISKDRLKDLQLSEEHCAFKIVYNFSDVPKNTRHQVLTFAKEALR